MKKNRAFRPGNWLALIFFAAAALSGQSPDPAKLFPDIAGWQKKGAVEIFSPEDLYKYIDGAAENFLGYDFKQLAVQNYANTLGQALSAEIYFHGTAENAFGIYSSEKPLAGDYIPLGGQGYAESGILNFVCSAFYVKLSGFELGPDGQDVLITLGRALAGKIDPGAVLPEIVQAFPAAGKIANSERFILNNFLGHDFLRKAYVADYRVNGQNFRLFIISAGSEAEAKIMLEKYMALDRGNPKQSLQPGMLAISDPYNGPLRIFWQGEFICGCLGQTPAAIEYTEAIARYLAKQQEPPQK
jgi:hypothetical protein